jgi:hypothetical protein
MVNNLQQTLQRKEDAIQNLARKSKTLSKAIEPRGAYKYKQKQMSGSSPSRTDISPIKSVTSRGDFSNSHFNNRSKSVIPQPTSPVDMNRTGPISAI